MNSGKGKSTTSNFFYSTKIKSYTEHIDDANKPIPSKRGV
jgi:hypothetical protein